MTPDLGCGSLVSLVYVVDLFVSFLSLVLPFVFVSVWWFSGCLFTLVGLELRLLVYFC